MTTTVVTLQLYLGNTTDAGATTCTLGSADATCSNCQLELAEYCLNDTTRYSECYPYNDALSIFAGVWCVLNCLFGATGNVLTLLAIPYAVRKRK